MVDWVLNIKDHINLIVSHWESQNRQETNQSGQDSAYWKLENTHSLSSGCGYLLHFILPVLALGYHGCRS